MDYLQFARVNFEDSGKAIGCSNLDCVSVVPSAAPRPHGVNVVSSVVVVFET